MSDEELVARLRKTIFERIEQCLAEDGYCKSYEGQLTVSKHYPNYFQHQDCETDPTWAVELHLCVFGPNRHYKWSGATLGEAVAKAGCEVASWMIEMDMERQLAVEDC